MDESELEQAKDLLLEALDLDGTAREALLARRCGGNPRLRERVAALLSAHERSPALLASLEGGACPGS